MALLGRGGSVGGLESLRVEELLPGHQLVPVGQAVYEGQVAQLLAHAGRLHLLIKAGHHLVELGLGVPQIAVHQLLQLLGLGLVQGGIVHPAALAGHAGQRLALAIHITINGGSVARVVAGLVARYGDLAAIVAVYLPEEAGAVAPLLLPSGKVLLQLLIERILQGLVGMHEHVVPHGLGSREGVGAH